MERLGRKWFTFRHRVLVVLVLDRHHKQKICHSWVSLLMQKTCRNLANLHTLKTCRNFFNSIRINKNSRTWNRLRSEFESSCKSQKRKNSLKFCSSNARGVVTQLHATAAGRSEVWLSFKKGSCSLFLSYLNCYTVKRNSDIFSRPLSPSTVSHPFQNFIKRNDDDNCTSFFFVCLFSDVLSTL